MSRSKNLPKAGKRQGTPLQRVGVVGGDSLVITDEDGAVLDVPVSELRGAWTGGLVSAVGLTELPKRP